MKNRLFAMIVAFWMAQSMFLQKKTVIINSCRHTDESGSGALAVTVPIL